MKKKILSMLVTLITITSVGAMYTPVYAADNTDTSNTNDSELISFEEFDYSRYADDYEDLYNAVGYNKDILYYHYTTAGIREGRVAYKVPEGLTPITWKPSSEHLILDSKEARDFYTRVKKNDYPTMDEIQSNPILHEIDDLSLYYVAKYGKTIEINTPERDQLRKDIAKEFIEIGSAQINSKADGSTYYTYDGPFKREYKCEIIIGLPASGKSTRVADPDSDMDDAFIFDCDVIKGLIPEYKESYGLAADAVHLESELIQDIALKEFTSGDMQGVNMVLPIVGENIETLFAKYISPLEKAGYDVQVKYCHAEANESLARNIARELETGRVINSKVVLSFEDKPYWNFALFQQMKNADGVPYVR